MLMAQGTQLLGCVYLYPTAVRNLSHICVCVWPFGSVSKPHSHDFLSFLCIELPTPAHPLLSRFSEMPRSSGWIFRNWGLRGFPAPYSHVGKHGSSFRLLQSGINHNPSRGTLHLKKQKKNFPPESELQGDHLELQAMVLRPRNRRSGGRGRGEPRESLDTPELQSRGLKPAKDGPQARQERLER